MYSDHIALIAKHGEKANMRTPLQAELESTYMCPGHWLFIKMF